MNILFLANRFPYPPFRGDKLKIYNLAKRLSNKHNLFLLTFVQERKEYTYVDELKKYFKKIELIRLPKYVSVLKCMMKVFSVKPYQIVYFGSKQFRRLYDNFLKENKIDVIHTQHLRMSQYSGGTARIKRILDLPDAYSLYWNRRANLKRNLFLKLFDYIEYRKVLRYERIVEKFDLNLVCSDEDRLFLKEFHNINNIEILPNGVDLDTFKNLSHDYGINNRIIFTGNMDYVPNVDAVCYFVSDIFPIILKKLPGVKFYIVGQRPVRKVLRLQSESVVVSGFAPDLSKEYDKSAVAVSPVRIGAGTLNKVLEPMALGVPVVTTNVGFKGLGVSSGEGVILAADADQFADEVIKLLSDEKYRSWVGSSGKKVVEEKFDWDNIARLLEKYFEDVISNTRNGL